MSTPTPIALVVFDMDGVLAHLDSAKRLRELSELTGRSPEVLHEAIYASGFEHDAEAGAYPTGAEYLAEYNRRIESSLTREQWVAVRKNAMTPIPGTWRLARQIKSLVPLATLTNNGALLKEAIGEILPEAIDVFGTSFHASYEFGARKPNPNVFTRLAARYKLAPHRVLFIDDQPDYVAGARAAGLRTIRFTNPEALIAELTPFGIEPDSGRARPDS